MQQPEHALVFALDISKTNTGVAVLRVPLIQQEESGRWNQGKIKPVFLGQIKAEFSQGAQRIWWPTSRSQFESLRVIVQSAKAKYPDDPCILAYEGAAYGQNTSEMMVYLQQRLFEWVDSCPDCNMDLLGFTPAFTRKAARLMVDVDHISTAKSLARAIFDKINNNPGVYLDGPLPLPKNTVSQDTKDALIIGIAAAISTVQFLDVKPVQLTDTKIEWVFAYQSAQVKWDTLSTLILATRGAGSHPHPSHPFNFKELVKDLKKRDEPHISPKNPYVYPVRTYRVRGMRGPMTAHEGIYWRVRQGLDKQGSDLLQETLIHRH